MHADARHMAQALALGRRGLGRTWPNPSVGCVIVKDGRIIGRGVTATGGRPHAEPQALEMAGEAAKGATAYVTLEPCAHTGQTPPCADALINAGIARVVIALSDPDPRTNGAGAARLIDAGIDVTTGVLEAEARVDQQGFLTKITQQRPMLTLKLATSFDGRIATATGESQWITDAPARRLTHALRATHDAVMVGGGTARADDPTLNVRGLGITHQPTRIVLSRKLDLPLSSKLAATAKDIPLLICHAKDADPNLITAWQGLGATLIEVPTNAARQLDPKATMQALAEHGLTRIFCEGGGALAASLLQADLVDHLAGFTAGLALGAEGIPSISALGLNELAKATRFKLRETRAIGPDVYHHWSR